MILYANYELVEEEQLQTVEHRKKSTLDQIKNIFNTRKNKTYEQKKNLGNEKKGKNLNYVSKEI